tara:strand:+ start:2110 stop:3261 length:1152 start_codon:yes stop_codon:yes gene_type:complete
MPEGDVLFAGGKCFYLSMIWSSESHGNPIKDQNMREFLISKVSFITGSAAKDAFPITQPSSFRKATVPKIINDSYCCSLKTDGVRHILILTKYNDTPVAALLDRNMNLHEVEVWATEDYFNDSVFDGEIVSEESKTSPKRQIFLLFDAYCVKGKSLLLEDYMSRVQKMNTSIFVNGYRGGGDREVPDSQIEDMLSETDTIYVPASSGFQIHCKCILPATNAKMVWNRKRETPHLNDGLIFTPNTVVLTEKKVFKWKTHHTLDVLVEKSSSDPCLLYKGETIRCPAIHLEKHEFILYKVRKNVLVDSFFEKFDERETGIFECICDINSMNNYVTLSPIKVRVDKSSPNSMYTVRETLINVLENIQIQELDLSKKNQVKRKKARA